MSRSHRIMQFKLSSTIGPTALRRQVRLARSAKARKHRDKITGEFSTSVPHTKE